MMMRRQKASGFTSQVATYLHTLTQKPSGVEDEEQPDEARFALYGVAAFFDLLPISSADTLGFGGNGL